MWLLEIRDLHGSMNGKEVLRGIDLRIREGETHVIFGPNGSGKTTLLTAIMGMPGYQPTSGSIWLRGEDITHASVDERARMGIGLAFQRPPTIHGVKTRDMVRISSRDAADAEALAARLHLTDFLDRDINDGFSGGEIKRSELLQLLAQNPTLVLLDEPDSGVDLENVHLMGQMISQLLERDKQRQDRRKSGLIITHTGLILDYVDVDHAHVLCDGVMSCSGVPRAILADIKRMGYEECHRCRRRI